MSSGELEDETPQGRNWLLFLLGSLLLVLALAILLFGRDLLDRARPSAESSGLAQIPAFSEPDVVTDPAAGLSAGALPEPGDPAPDFTLVNLEGDEVALSDLRGHPVILNFWATWCAPCRLEMPELEATQQRHAGNGLTVITINQAESADTVAAFYDELGLTMPALLDTNGDVANQYGAFFLPSTVFIDAEGQVTAIHRGIIAESQIEDYLQTTIPPQS